VRLLIDAGANVNPKAALEAPLQFQAEVGDANSVKALVEAGANMEAGSSPNGWTALMWAAHKPNPAIVEALLRGGAKVNAKDGSGRTALDMVPRFSLHDVMLISDDDVERMRLSAGEVERMLLSAGAVSGHPAN
jgi:ankyrin repeat protein